MSRHPRLLPSPRTLSPGRRAAAAALALAAVGLLLAGPARAAGNPRRTPTVEVVERTRPAVVNIHSERTAQGPAMEELFVMAPSQNRINGMGTGVLIDPRGYIVTNQHVVEDVNVIIVRLADGGKFTARVLARSTEEDLALLKIDAGRPLPTVPLGTSSDLMVGEKVIAIGNAYGYDGTVTDGIVSALKRDVTLNKEVSYKSLIQTNAAINPGNSGGPLLNINGELIGINVAIRAGAQGISFAIPVDTMIRVAADMISVRKRNGTWHGLVCRDRVDVDAADAKPDTGLTALRVPSLNYPTATRSLVVERAEANGPGARAGLQTGDVVVQVGDQAVACSLDLERALLDRSAGEHVPVVVRRGTAQQRLDLLLQAADQAQASPTDLVWRKLGLRLKPVAAGTVSQSNQQLHGGLTVVDVQTDGVAGKAGVQRGDILVGLHNWETLTLDNVLYVLNHQDLKSFTPLRFYIVRSGQVHRGWFPQID